MQTAKASPRNDGAIPEAPVDGLAESPLVLAEEHRVLLERHKPILRFDRQYDYKPASVLGAVENHGNLLRTGHGELVARAGDEPDLSLELLATYTREFEAGDDDCLCLAPDTLGDARAMEADPRYAGRLYGRVVDDGGRTWLQYWFWLYYNPKNLFGFGKHEGDWEMVQLGMGPGGRPEVATYAQHDTGEARRFRPGDMELVERDGSIHPVVYVAPLSHACYFESGTHPYPIGIDHPYGDGPESRLPVEALGPWVDWCGRWGSSERAIAGRVGQAPRGPAHQGVKWDRPAAFHARVRRRRLRLLLGRLLHFLGRGTYPHPPTLRASIEGRRCVIEWELARSGLRRARHLYLTVHDEERVIASRILRQPPQSGRAALRLAQEPSAPAVWGSTFNRARQRSDLARADLA
jgi:hypothetical protein